MTVALFYLLFQYQLCFCCCCFRLLSNCSIVFSLFRFVGKIFFFFLFAQRKTFLLTKSVCVCECVCSFLLFFVLCFLIVLRLWLLVLLLCFFLFFCLVHETILKWYFLFSFTLIVYVGVVVLFDNARRLKYVSMNLMLCLTMVRMKIRDGHPIDWEREEAG